MCDRYLGKDKMNHPRKIEFRLHSSIYVYMASDTTSYCGESVKLTDSLIL